MPQMNFDLEDGQEPVSFMISNADSERFMAFMADCTDAIRERRELLGTQNAHLDHIEQLEKKLDELTGNRKGFGSSSECSPWSVTDEKTWFAYCPDEDGCDEDGHYWGGDYEYFCNYQLLPVEGVGGEHG